MIRFTSGRNSAILRLHRHQRQPGTSKPTIGHCRWFVQTAAADWLQSLRQTGDTCSDDYSRCSTLAPFQSYKPEPFPLC